MHKKIIQLGAGPLQIHSIVQLRDAGYEVHALDKSSNAPGFQYADKYDTIDILDTESIIKYAQENHIDAIIALNDAGVVPAADASFVLGLKNTGKEAARFATDKGLMREAWHRKKLSQPKFIIVDSAEKIEEAIYKMGFPCIVKPCLNWGSKGVTLVNNSESVEFAINFSKENDRNGRFIIEQFILGTEMTYEGLVKEGIVQILSRSDKVHQQHDRFKVAMQLNYPPALPNSWVALADTLVKHAASALGIINGAIHCELMINEDGAYLVEMAVRPGGGHIFGKIVEAQSGVPMPVSLVKIFLGETIDITPRFQKGVSYRFFGPPNGIFQSVKGIDKAKDIEGVLDIGFLMKPGTKVNAISGDADRPGYLVTVAKTRDEAIDLANKIVNSIEFTVS